MQLLITVGSIYFADDIFEFMLFVFLGYVNTFFLARTIHNVHQTFLFGPGNIILPELFLVIAGNQMEFLK